MGPLTKLGRQLEEAVHRQGQILPTENEAWGFFGSVATHFEGEADMPAIWGGTFKAFLEVFPGVDPKVVRDFLDSKSGRHFADQALDDPRLKDSMNAANRVVKGLLRSSGGKWVAKDLSKLAGTEAGVPPGGTAEMSLKVKAVTTAFASVQDEERKKNWKQQGTAMHALEKAADGLVTAVRSWFTNSGRAQTHEVWAGGGKGKPYRKVSVTIPEAAEADPKRELMEESREGAQFHLQLTELLRHWADIQHLRARIYGSGTPMDAKNKKERDKLNDEHEEHVAAIEAGLKKAEKLFASWKQG